MMLPAGSGAIPASLWGPDGKEPYFVNDEGTNPFRPLRGSRDGIASYRANSVSCNSTLTSPEANEGSKHCFTLDDLMCRGKHSVDSINYLAHTVRFSQHGIDADGGYQCFTDVVTVHRE
jgi:hypothetical protein